MFKIADPLNDRAPPHEHWSFAEVADEIGCSEGDLRRRFDDPTHNQVPYVDEVTGIHGTRRVAVAALTGFMALHLSDHARLVVERGVSRGVMPPEGFPGFVRLDEVERASGMDGVKFAALLEEAKIRETRVACLSAEGRQWALQNLGGLAIDALPAEVTGAAVAKYRDSIRHAVANAATEFSARGKPFTAKDREAVIERARESAIRAATQPEPA